MVYCWSVVGQGINSGRTNTKSEPVKVNGLVKKLKKLKKFISPADSSPVYTLFDGEGHPYNGTRREYLSKYIADSVSRSFGFAGIEDDTSVKVIDYLVGQLFELSKEHARDDMLKKDISVVIAGLTAKTGLPVFTMAHFDEDFSTAFEHWEADLYRKIRKYLEK